MRRHWGLLCKLLERTNGFKNVPKIKQRIHYAFSAIQFHQLVFVCFLLIPSEWYIWSMTCNLPGSIHNSIDRLSTMIISSPFLLNHGSTRSSKLLTHCQGGMCCATGTTGITTPGVVRNRACWSGLAWYSMIFLHPREPCSSMMKRNMFLQESSRQWHDHSQQSSCSSQQFLVNTVLIQNASYRLWLWNTWALVSLVISISFCQVLDLFKFHHKADTTTRVYVSDRV